MLSSFQQKISNFVWKTIFPFVLWKTFQSCFVCFLREERKLVHHFCVLDLWLVPSEKILWVDTYLDERTVSNPDEEDEMPDNHPIQPVGDSSAPILWVIANFVANHQFCCWSLILKLIANFVAVYFTGFTQFLNLFYPKNGNFEAVK